jgi:hypothetical protein
MRTLPLSKLVAAVALLSLAGCSGGGSSSIAPKPASLERAAHRFASFDSCPASGPIKYVSDFNNNLIQMFVGKFAGQAPCGQLTSKLASPWGLFVLPSSHDLYVANYGAQDIVVFHRGQSAPYNAYTDPGFEDPVDVTVARDGTVIATNQTRPNHPIRGSISTWIGGPNGGTFVGNFPMTNDIQGGFLTVQRNGTVYFDDQDSTTSHGVVWKVSCPAGACGSQTQIAGVSLGEPGGMASDGAEDLLVTDSQPANADTFELPNPTPSSFPIPGIVFGMAIDKSAEHWYVADALDNIAAEYSYPEGVLIGTVPGNNGGNLDGIAIDPAHER